MMKGKIYLKLLILDSGVTDHVCFAHKLFQCHMKIHPVHNKLPNGSLVNVVHIKYLHWFHIW